jgi:spore coat protein U-like protein
MQLKTALLAAAIAVAGLAVQPIEVAHAGTSTANMDVKITIQNACDVSTVAPTTLDFGTQGPLTAAVDNTSTITVTCTDGADYNVGLGGGGSGDTGARVMTNGTDNISYQLYSDSSHSNKWGDAIGTDTVASTGTGTTQTFTVYGEVPAQTTPPAGTYTDTVAVTVTY